MDIRLLALRVDCPACRAVAGKRCARTPLSPRSHAQRRQAAVIVALDAIRSGDHVRLLEPGWRPGATARVVGRNSSTGLTVMLPTGVAAVVGVREIEPMSAVERLGNIDA